MGRYPLIIVTEKQLRHFFNEMFCYGEQSGERFANDRHPFNPNEMIENFIIKCKKNEI